MAVTQTPLPFAKDALEPHMSARTFEYHYGKHHKAYVDNTNAAIKGTPLENASLEEIVKSALESKNQKLFNNSAQAWNHDFFWHSLTPKAAAPGDKLAEWITRDLGGFDKFKETFKAEAVGHFASGWAWLVVKDKKLAVTSFHDADTPLAHAGVTPLLTLDVWEHAYYLDHQNARPAFVDTFLTHLANWQGAAEKLAKVA
jgi:superoxide dismutase, Fe-Mn family